jgi:thiol-disulfide isomerase/thioredoxin
VPRQWQWQDNNLNPNPNPKDKEAMKKEATKRIAHIAVAAISICGGVAFAQTDAGQSLDGRWAATLTEGKITIPFRLEISGSGDHLVGTLFNGSAGTETTTSANYQNGVLELKFEHYLTTIKANAQNGTLDGQVIVQRRSPINITPGAYTATAKDNINPFHAIRYVASAPVAAANVPSIDGNWEIPHESSKGEKAWRLVVKQNGSEIETTVLRVDGDTGGLTGSWQDGKFVASHFDGSRPGLIELTPQSDGSLQVNLRAEPRNELFTAYRPEVARAKGFPEPANYLTHTSVRDPNEVFKYSFRDVNGNLVSNDDPRFKDKVVLAIVTGTWCPNCHDEAQYLVKLYAQYHDKGLEIVALDFEEADQQASHERVNAFIKQYKVPYTYLIAGTPDEMWDKVPQAVNLNTWPATLFIGRDGKVKATYSGFATEASGVYGKELKADFTSIVDRLLAGKDVDTLNIAHPAIASVAGGQ